MSGIGITVIQWWTSKWELDKIYYKVNYRLTYHSIQKVSFCLLAKRNKPIFLCLMVKEREMVDCY
jgi:hypothetical protein